MTDSDRLRREEEVAEDLLEIVLEDRDIDIAEFETIIRQERLAFGEVVRRECARIFLRPLDRAAIMGLDLPALLRRATEAGDGVESGP